MEVADSVRLWTVRKKEGEDRGENSTLSILSGNRCTEWDRLRGILKDRGKKFGIQ